MVIGFYGCHLFENILLKIIRTILLFTYQLSCLKMLQSKHNKVKNIHYNQLSLQCYLKSNLSLHHKELMLASRSKMLRNIQSNFSSSKQIHMCKLCFNHEDNQENVIKCQTILSHIKFKNNDIHYKDMFGQIDSQERFIIYYSELLNIRTLLLENSLPGHYILASYIYTVTIVIF